ncbi:type IV secretion system DNA-binding domain-containing protein [Candidatus Peregrinibacteria bacterium]|nr:MAG: type IV secretion system DNA-binding domain-containing protein [Candidatus Peregrinibacteria bacterium]
MSTVLFLTVGIFFLTGIGLFVFRIFLFFAKDRMRALDLVFLQVLIPKKDSKEDRDTEGEQFGTAKDVTKTVGVMTQLFSSLHALRESTFREFLFQSDFFTCEYSVIGGEVYMHLGVPRASRELVEKQITSYYPDAVVEETPAPNIFTSGNKIACCSMNLSKQYFSPIRTISRLESDSLNNILNTLSKIRVKEGAAIQIVCRPVPDSWQEKVEKVAGELTSQKSSMPIFQTLNPFRILGAFFSILISGPSGGGEETPKVTEQNAFVQEKIKAMEEKASKPGFDVVIRLVTAAATEREANSQLTNIKASFSQFSAPNLNGFSSSTKHSRKKLMRDYIYRNFSRNRNVLLSRFLSTGQIRQIVSSDELAALFHFPNAQYNKMPNLQWQTFKIAPAPHNLPEEGLLLGYNNYRGEKREVRIKRDDRRRHFYCIGKSGTGKSVNLENMIRQDLQNGEGVCVVDPHGDLVEAVLPYIPRERADDVILFDPGDLERPMGLNLLEAHTEEQKEFISQEALAIFIKLYGEEIMGPRLQHYFRNGVLTLMADDEDGATLLDITKLFTDINYEKMKKSKVKNPVVKSFWEKEMAKTGQREKEEMIPYFASKFGPFITNAQIRNILGQVKSGFDFRDVMDNRKILLVNLSKGKLGDLNSKLLGMIMVSKIQMAAMSRVDTPEKERKDFYLYVDEFQNFVTDSFASILSEARKYRLNLIVAHQYISQITQSSEGGKGKHEDSSLRDAVFGNVGSMMCFKIGAHDAETMEKEFQPVFSQQDLINIANYQAYIKLNINNATSRGFSLQTIYDPTGADNEGAEAFRQLSRLKFGRDREFVGREIARRVM